MRDDQLPDVPALRPLEPPPGGLTRLRAALDAEPRRDGRARWAIAAAALAVIAVVWLALAVRRAPASPDLVVIAPPPPRPAPVADPTIAAVAAAPAVEFYWVSSRPAPPP